MDGECLVHGIGRDGSCVEARVDWFVFFVELVGFLLK